MKANIEYEVLCSRHNQDDVDELQGYHVIQAFALGEVGPEEAHAIGQEFVQRLLGDRYEAVVTTHLDREHLHNHIVFNSVSFMDGKMYRNRFG